MCKVCESSLGSRGKDKRNVCYFVGTKQAAAAGKPASRNPRLLCFRNGSWVIGRGDRVKRDEEHA